MCDRTGRRMLVSYVIMKVTSITEQPFIEIPFLNAGKGQGSFYVDRLPIHTGQAVGLPEELDSIVATADLQGRERFQEAKGGPLRLLGEVLPDRLCADILPELNISPDRTGVILAGDFYTVPALDKRGGSGDVTAVWQSFASCFRWVVGVAGNHDTFGDSLHPRTGLSGNAYYLDGTDMLLDGMTIAGIGGIIGNHRKPHRKTDHEYAGFLELLLEPPPNLLVLHDGPDYHEFKLRGSSQIRQTMEQLPPTLVVRGHAHWPTPLVQLANETQILNVDCRVVILRRA